MSTQKSFLARLFSRKPKQAVLPITFGKVDLPLAMPAKLPEIAKETHRKRVPSCVPSYYIPTNRSPWTVVYWSRSNDRWEWINALFRTQLDARKYAKSDAFHPNVRTRVVRPIIPTR